MTTGRSYQLAAAVGFLLGAIGLVDLGYLLAGERPATRTVILVVIGMLGLVLGVVAAVKSHHVRRASSLGPRAGR